MSCCDFLKSVRLVEASSLASRAACTSYKPRGAGFGVFDPSFDLLKVAKDGTGTHLVKGKDVVAVNQHEEL
jgi:hypothetical protein